MLSILQDFRYAVRQLRKSPVFALTAVTMLALGLGANIAVFTVLNGILLRPLPYARPNRVAAIELSGPMPYYSLSYANMLQLRDAVGSRLKIGAVLSGGAAYASVVGPGGRYQVSHMTVTTGLFDMLGVQPILGRSFREAENQPGQTHVLLIGEDVWRQVFNSDPQVVGKTLTVRHEPYTVIGVLPKDFFFWYASQMTLWSPAEIPPAAHSAMSGKGTIYGSLFARLPDNISASQLAADLSRAQEVIAKEAPSDELPTRVKVTSYQDSLTENVRKPLMLLYGVVVGIWMLACLNVTSLMLVRAVSRTREHAVRAALGASRGRLLRQTIVESLLVSVIGASAGMLLGQSVIKLLWRQIERHLPLTRAIHVDLRIVLCLVAFTLLTAVCTGIFPALRAMRRDVRDSLSGVNSTSSAGANRTREILVVGQLALTLVFLVSAGLFLRTIHALRQVPLGFTQQNVLTGGIILNASESGGNGSAPGSPNIFRTSYQPLLERLRAIPGVRDAGLSSVLPLRTEMMVTVSASIDHGKEQMADGRLASAGLDEALGIPMVSGRFFNEEDTVTSPAVAVINQAYASKYLPGQNPIGHIISMGKGRFHEIRIVGVVSDMKQFNLSEPTKPEIYFCLAQTEPGTPLYGIATAFMQVALRGAVPADNLRAQFDKVLHEVAPDATTTNVKTIHEAVEDSFGSQTLIARLLETFAGLALMIASVGLYGLLSFSVAQRTREIGIRLVLGALQGNILRLILRRAFLLVVIGLGLGGVLAWFATRFAGSYIYGVREHDAFTFISVTLMLATSAFFAAWLPARRAAAVDPILALRSE